jgi:hypothetical protein
MKRGLFTVAIVTAAAALVGIAYAAVTGPFPVKTTTANELVPAATATWFAWTQSPAAYPNRVNVYAEDVPVDGAGVFRVNPAGTRAWAGGIDGNTLAYQEIANGQSNIRLYDLSAKMRSTHPYINTLQWEWRPTISGEWILFGRQSRTSAAEKILLHNTLTHITRTLASTTRSDYALYPGQVNGNWATFTACTPRCNVRRYNISLDNTSPIPKPSTVAHQYADSVTDDGTVYFAASGSGCGVNVKIVRYRLSDGRVVLSSVSSGKDIFFTSTSEELDGSHVYYDRIACSTGAANIYKIIDGP